MRALLIVLGILTASIFSGQDCHGKLVDDTRFQVSGMSFDSRLRSAYLQRSSGIDRIDEGFSISEGTIQLQEHFDVVLQILVQRSPSALAIAARRLETARGETWSTDERARWIEFLAARRAENIVRLVGYRDAGRFPINEHADHAVPVFVDNRDTACAVGFLMRASGWSEEVAAIRDAHNLVYVPDAPNSAIGEWALESGLLIEEAALIQPAYASGPPADASTSFAVGAPSITALGLRYTPVYFEGFYGNSTLISAASIGVYARHGDGYLEDCFSCGSFTPQYDRWVQVQGPFSFGPLGNMGIASSQGQQSSEGGYLLKIEAVNANQWINAVTIMSNEFIGFNGYLFYENGGHGSAYMEIAGGLATISNTGPRINGRQTITFPAQKSVTISVFAGTAGGFAIPGLAHEISLVPEPTIANLGGMGLGGAWLARRRRAKREFAIALLRSTGFEAR